MNKKMRNNYDPTCNLMLKIAYVWSL